MSVLTERYLTIYRSDEKRDRRLCRKGVEAESNSGGELEQRYHGADMITERNRIARA